MHALTYVIVTFITLLCVYIFYLRDFWRVKKILALDFPVSYEKLLIETFKPFSHLNDEQKNNLKYKILYFLKYKNFWGIGDFEITENMKVIIAAQACLLILKQRSVISFPQLTNIYISSGPYIDKENLINVRTMLPKT